MIYAKIAGTGRYLPDRIMTNRDWASIVDTTEEWIRSRTGIDRRHIAADTQATSDLAEHAAREAMAAAGVTLLTSIFWWWAPPRRIRCFPMWAAWCSAVCVFMAVPPSA